MKDNNPMKLIEREKIEFESTLGTIKLLLATINDELGKDCLDSLMVIVGWSGVTNDEEDRIFMSKLLSNTSDEVEKYFFEKDEIVMQECHMNNQKLEI
jgi:hypothetical protein